MKLLWTRGLTLVGALAGLLAAAPARAEQIVLFDITYTHTNANDSHHSISGAALNQPANWTSPIDYTKGTIHFYQEVMTKPSTKPTIIDFCLISARDYGCIETFIYTHTGLHETVRSMAGGDVDKRNVIDFTQRMRSIQMVLKTPAPTWINGGRPQSDYLPSMMRFVATLVSPGGTYMKPAATPGFNSGDGGAAASPADAGVSPTTDAAAPGTGGSSGSGGSGGTGGGGGGGGSGGSGGSTDAVVVADAATGTTTPPSQPPAVDAAAPSNPPPRPPTPSPGSGGQSGSTGGKSSVAGGCSMGGDAASEVAPLLGLLLLAGIGRLLGAAAAGSYAATQPSPLPSLYSGPLKGSRTPALWLRRASPPPPTRPLRGRGQTRSGDSGRDTAPRADRSPSPAQRERVGVRVCGPRRRTPYSNGSTNFFFLAAGRRFTAAVRRAGRSGALAAVRAGGGRGFGNNRSRLDRRGRSGRRLGGRCRGRRRRGLGDRGHRGLGGRGGWLLGGNRRGCLGGRGRRLLRGRTDRLRAGDDLLLRGQRRDDGCGRRRGGRGGNGHCRRGRAQLAAGETTADRRHQQQGAQLQRAQRQPPATAPLPAGKRHRRRRRVRGRG